MDKKEFGISWSGKGTVKGNISVLYFGTVFDYFKR